MLVSLKVQVLHFRSSFAVWRSVHFFGHLAIAGLCQFNAVRFTSCSSCPDCGKLPSLTVVQLTNLTEIPLLLSVSAAITMYAVVFPPKRPKKPVEPAGKAGDQADGAVATHGTKQE